MDKLIENRSIKKTRFIELILGFEINAYEINVTDIILKYTDEFTAPKKLTVLDIPIFYNGANREILEKISCDEYKYDYAMSTLFAYYYINVFKNIRYGDYVFVNTNIHIDFIKKIIPHISTNQKMMNALGYNKKLNSEVFW